MLREKRFIVVTVALILLALACGQKGRNESTVKRAAVADFSAPVKVSTANTDAAEPAIAASADGSLFVVWVEHREKKESDVMLARLDANGKAASEPVRVNVRAGMATSWRGDPPTVAVGPEKPVQPT
jgi:ABC-type Na+ efflux pump permease subunit